MHLTFLVLGSIWITAKEESQLNKRENEEGKQNEIVHFHDHFPIKNVLA